MNFNKFIDFDNAEQIFYCNMYSNDDKFVIKIPISEIRSKKKKNEIKIENFDLTKYTFLLNIE